MVLWIVIGLSWVALLSRLPRYLPLSPAAHTNISQRLWPPAVLMALAGTLYAPPITDALGHLLPGLSFVPCNSLAALAYLFTCRICHDFLPAHRRAGPAWMRAGGLLTIAAHSLLALGAPVPLPARQALAGMVFSSLLLVATQHVVLPALAWSAAREQILPTRFRLRTLSALFVAVSLWMVSDLIRHSALLLKLPPYPDVLDRAVSQLVIAGVGLPYILVFYTSRPFEAMAHLQRMATALRLAALDDHMQRYLAARPVGFLSYRPAPPDPGAIWRSPDTVTYQAVIAILDKVKLLRAHAAHPPEARLAARLALATSPSIDYDEVVARLVRVAGDDLLRLALVRLSGALSSAFPFSN